MHRSSRAPSPIAENDMRLAGSVILLPLLLALSAVTHPAAAQPPSTFVIAASEGYGIGDCLAAGGTCGKLIADAWCSAHGAARAVSFGPAADSAEPAEQRTARISPGSLVISCGR